MFSWKITFKGAFTGQLVGHQDSNLADLLQFRERVTHAAPALMFLTPILIYNLFIRAITLVINLLLYRINVSSKFNWTTCNTQQLVTKGSLWNPVLMVYTKGSIYKAQHYE